MPEKQSVTLPNIGDFKDVEIVEIPVAVGQAIDEGETMIILESDKAAMEIPSPAAGKVAELKVQVGDKVSEGDLILTLEAAEGANGGEESESAPAEPAAAAAATEAGAQDEPAAAQTGVDLHAEVLVLGAGPGGYTAAFRAADLGKKTVLVERHAALGGVCLNVGCIPSKALLHAAAILEETREMEKMGIRFGKPEVDIEQMRQGKDQVVQRLTGGLKQLAKQRKVGVVRGDGRFVSRNRLRVETAEGAKVIEFEHAIIACGSRPVQIPSFPHDDPRMLDSTGALELEDVPERMLVIGGGIIGLEMATVYSALGTAIDIVELQNSLIPGCDKDLVKPLEKRIKKRYRNIMLGTKVTEIRAEEAGLVVDFEGKQAPKEMQTYDKVLVAVGRVPNGKLIGAEAAGVQVDERGFIPVDDAMRTNVKNIFAIGDVVGQPMLAHKASHEAKVAAEVIAGRPSRFDPLTIPSVAYTDPEVAWMGLTETEAKAQGVEYEKGVFPWAASGRALGIGRDEGLTKLLFDPKTRRILGAGIAGPNAGELIGETVLALEMGADLEDIALSVHPHPTLSETIAMAAEMGDGSITDLLPPKKRK